MERQEDKIMQIFYPDKLTAVALCFFLWFVFQVLSAYICFKIPDRFFAEDNAVFRARRFEKEGLFYRKYLIVHKWKKLLPDGGAVIRNGYSKRHLNCFSVECLERYLIESRRGEMTHWLAILPFWIFGLFAPFYIVPIMLLYSLVVNMPCIIAQRYNRPRISELINKLS